MGHKFGTLSGESKQVVQVGHRDDRRAGLGGHRLSGRKPWSARRGGVADHFLPV